MNTQKILNDKAKIIQNNNFVSQLHTTTSGNMGNAQLVVSLIAALVPITSYRLQAVQIAISLSDNALRL